MSDKPSRTTFRKRLDEMVSQLREEIVAGKRAIGEFLPSEQALGEQFQLSKIPSAKDWTCSSRRG
ncbi:hypothetical protein PACILC2_55140 [Paenibacillus cisolokensis]|uniref:HTH gntR-type domain-containing protein n=1 Tax=Paenibacillus cisolokensis TaxID=1658519 RepID=A0ABQ4NGC6_9BACL|nr:GntR family transcriptional regulator [Paenibacillus cisolokensis]GIQ66946.1 hypothetical protein PACILC2_55140 [Paenibacillus cisolokensis]